MMSLVPMVIWSLSLCIGAIALNQVQQAAAAADAPTVCQVQPASDAQPSAPMTLDELRDAAGEEPMGPFACDSDVELASADESVAQSPAAVDAVLDESKPAPAEEAVGPPEPDNLVEDDPVDAVADADAVAPAADPDEVALADDADIQAVLAAQAVAHEQWGEFWSSISNALEDYVAQIPAMLEEAGVEFQGFQVDAMAQKLQAVLEQ